MKLIRFTTMIFAVTCAALALFYPEWRVELATYSSYSPIAGFSASPTSGEAPFTVNFTDESTGTIDTWVWSFGDGSTSNLQNPTNTYSDVGTYDVALTVSNSTGSDTETKLNYITETSSLNAFVTRFYQQCLNREPDTAGLNSWVDSLSDRTLSGADLANGFIFSPEFVARDTTNGDFVIILYRAFFNREPDTGGYTVWVEKLNDGESRQTVLDGFIYSTEFEELCASYGIDPYSGSSELVQDFVTRFYQQCLSRDPDTAGLNSWVDSLLDGSLSGADLANGFIFSPEFVARDTSNGRFVIILYRAFFDREPDTGGYTVWVDTLDNGESRQNVLDGFLYSQEFEDLCTSYGIAPYSA